jgi:hypothetical protein
MIIDCEPVKNIGNNQGQRAATMQGSSRDSPEFKRLQIDRQA